MTERELDDFEGLWRLSKEITPNGDAPARFDGTARWSRDGDAMNYVETGDLHLQAGGVLVAERRYRWEAPLRVFFDDGRFFHDVPAGGGRAHHDCPPDVYEVLYDFGDWPNWSCRWQVAGPRKDYTMSCRYTPMRH
jgi:hypothetical protein